MNDLRVATGNEQGQKRKLWLRVGKKGREQVPLHVMHADAWDMKRLREAAPESRADHERAWKPGTRCIGDTGQVFERHVGIVKHALQQRGELSNVIARSEFRHHAAERLVNVGLGRKRFCDDAARLIIDSNAGVVAGCLDAEGGHVSFALE